MADRRPTIPKAVRESVLSEFNHRCAICGKDRPHLHHIDADPVNNHPNNLIPLCPNHHLTDQHNPTAPMEPGLLELFRRYKDPVILRPQFVPLFNRMRFLYQRENPEAGLREGEAVVESVKELLDFVSVLKMGTFYSKQLTALLGYKAPSAVYVRGMARSDAAVMRGRFDHMVKYLDRVRANRREAEALLIELLRYQPWHPEREDS